MVCYGYTHLLKITKDDIMTINDNDASYLLPVITIATCTDLGKNLNRDSFTILKFIEEPNIGIHGCVEENSEEECTLKDNIMDFLSHSSSLPTIRNVSDFKNKYFKYKNKYLILKKKINKAK
jgi:hypothetical protein